MGFLSLLRRAPPQQESVPTSITKPRVLGNGKGLKSPGKENIAPRKGNGSNKRSGANPKKGKKGGKDKNGDKKSSKKSKKRGFWGRKQQKNEAAPKLSIFLQQADREDVGSVATASLTASHTIGSKSSKSLSTASSSSFSRPQAPLHLQTSGSNHTVEEEKVLRSQPLIQSEGPIPSRSTQEGSRIRRDSSPTTTRESFGSTSELDKESLIAKSRGNYDRLSGSKTTIEKPMTPPPQTAVKDRPSLDRQLTPHPLRPKKKSENKASSKRLSSRASKHNSKSKAAPSLSEDNRVVKSKPLHVRDRVHVVDEADCSVGSNDGVFDGLNIANDFANEDLVSAEPLDDESSAFRITNMKSVPMLSPLSSINSLSTNMIIDEDVKLGTLNRSFAKEFAVIGSSNSNGDTFVRDVSGLQDIIDEVEKDMMELDSLFAATGSKPQEDRPSEQAIRRATRNSGWISNGAILDSNSSEEASVISFDSDEFAEDDDIEQRPIVTRSTSFEITTIIEENESDDDPLEAALIRGELLSMDAEDGTSSGEDPLYTKTKSISKYPSKISSDLQSKRTATNESVRTDSDLSESLSSAHEDTSNSPVLADSDLSESFGSSNAEKSTKASIASGSVSDLSDSFSSSRKSNKKSVGSVHTDSDLSNSFGSPSSSLTLSSKKKKLDQIRSSKSQSSRQITKTLSWKDADEVYTYTQTYQSIHLEMALEMVRSYDPRYSSGTKRPLSSPTVTKPAHKPLKSILKKSKSWSPREFNNSEESSVSAESSSSTISSNATSESVQYMVKNLKKEAARRRKRKITIRNSTSVSNTHCISD